MSLYQSDRKGKKVVSKPDEMLHDIQQQMELIEPKTIQYALLTGKDNFQEGVERIM